MNDPTEWLVEYSDANGETAYDHIASRENAIDYLRQLVGQGKTATLYQRVSFTVQVDVTVQAPRKRRRKEATEGAATPKASEASDGSAKPEAQELDPGIANSPAGEKPVSPVSLVTSTERAAPPRAEEPTTKDAAAQEPAPSPVVGSAEPTASLSLWSCEASWPGDAECPGPAEFDPVSKGRFCGLHARSITESGRIEFHRRHGARNAPKAPVVRLAHVG